MGSTGIDLLSKLLTLDPAKRINAIDALCHEYFTSEPLPLKPGDVPKFNDSHELDGKKNRPRGPPPAPAGGSVGVVHNGTKAGEVPWQGGAPATAGGRRPPDWVNGNGNARHDVRQYGPPPAGNRVQPQGFRGPPAPPEHRQAEHRPAWSRGPGHTEDPLPYRDAGLPPRPPSTDFDRERGPPQRTSRGPASNVDTYIPSYAGGEDRRRDNFRERGYERDRGGSRDRSDWRDRPYNAPGRSMSRDRSRDISRESSAPYRR